MNNLYTADDSPFSDIQEDTTVDRDRWLLSMKERSPYSDLLSGGYWISLDFEVEELLRDVIIAYTEGPVGYHKDKVFEVYTKNFKEMKYIEEFLRELKASDSRIIFYMAVRHDVKEEFKDSDEGYKNLPKYWFIRYAIVKSNS